MKKLIATGALISLIGIFGIQMASADPAWYGSGERGYGYCNNYYGWNGPDEKTIQTIKEFDKQTSEIRKQLVVKRAELRALMEQDNPDEKRAAELTADLYDLKETLQEKAEQAGIPARGYGRHMMDW
jgi:Spy/CpxP family protein refolding chaperone